MANQWDSFKFTIAEHFLAPMVNGDYSGMTTDDCMAYREWEQGAYHAARESGFTVGHWSAEESEGFTRCNVTGLHADCVRVKLMVYKALPKPVAAPTACPALCTHGKGFNCGKCWPSAH